MMSNDLTLCVMHARALGLVEACIREWVSRFTFRSGCDDTSLLRCSANTMSSALEVLGMSLPYSSGIPSIYPGMLSETYRRRPILNDRT